MVCPVFFHTASELPRSTERIDALEGAYRELFFVEHPAIGKTHPDAPMLVAKFLKSAPAGVWAYYPWRKTAVRIPPEALYYRLRTARNRDLISENEQRAYRDMAVGIAGLSVGSAVLATLVATGGAKRLSIADPDVIEITNLNRMRATLVDVRENKAVAAARNAWELDPFARIKVRDKGLRRADLKQFLKGLDLFIDEMDDIGMKAASRQACKAAGIPVVMATDNGDGVILDIERYDFEPDRPIFHGRVSLPSGDLSDLSRETFVALANEIIDPYLFTDRQRDSIAAIGSRLSGVAQIATASALAGAAVAFAARRIAARLPLPSGRYLLDCESVCIPGYTSATAKKARRAHARAFIRASRKPKPPARA